MELHLLPILALLCLVLVGTDSSSPAEEYWHSVLPKTPIPQPIQDLLKLDAGNDQNEKLSDVKGVPFHWGYDTKDENEKLWDIKGAPFQWGYDTKDQNEKLWVIKGVPFQWGYDTKDQNEKLSDIKGIPFHWGYDTKDQTAKADLIHQTVFYKYNDIHPGQKLRPSFNNGGNKVPFLPRELAESVPFSSDKVKEILQLFSIEPNSPDAAIVSKSIRECEHPNFKGENKYCATSLESLVDQNVARLGQNIQVVSTPTAKRQEYTILPGMKMIANDRTSVCHRKRYPYAVYYCHEIKETEVYRVPLLGGDGTKISAITICHKDTSGWIQGHIAFKILKIQKPGPPVCHFVYSDSLVWLQTSNLGHVSV